MIVSIYYRYFWNYLWLVNIRPTAVLFEYLIIIIKKYLDPVPILYELVYSHQD